jgi:mono/diheme cytochrome c family protein
MATKLPPVDVVLVGFGWTASILGQELTDAGLHVLALERGAFRDTVPDFATTRIQDELRYAVRNELFEEPERETLTFRNSADQTALPMRHLGSFKPASGAGGAGVHWNGQNWRFLPADDDAIKRYLDTLKPVREENKPTKLPWPFSVREVMAGWNTLYFKEGTFRSNPQKSAEWNLGAYLVEGLGHCGACHTPKNFAGAPKRDQAFQGGYGENWYATSLGGDLRDGLGSWSMQDIMQYLKTGANARAAAFGPMGEVVHDSTQHLDDKDLHAMAVYLKDLPPHESRPANSATAAGSGSKQDADRLARGRGFYLDDCAGCHMENGEGIAGVFPPLKGNAVVQAKDPETVVHVILSGQKTAVTRDNPAGLAMPAFDWKLGNDEIADLVTYLRSAWGNAAGAVSGDKVADTRSTVVAARTK